MASGAGKSAAFIFLLINVLLYFIVIVIAAWSINHAIEKTHETASVLTVPARIFPIFFPLGNMATGFLVIFSLIAGLVGLVTSLLGMNNVMQWDTPNLHTAAASSLATWTLTLLAMGLACKEIDIGWVDSNLRALETLLIILSGTQLFATAAIHLGVEDVVARDNRAYGGRV
ncbi:membrane protein PM19L-like [Apium graveolens]|uniref:membrane protein PM19L-like n=1 Tax=Apium graveolens TaxID=4045 RepID=UPI003D7A6AB2